jgi:hypothetical protein
MNKVFLATHEYENSSGCEVLKILGVFLTKDSANAAIDQIRNQEGFREHPNGFDVAEWTIGEINWPAGFISWSQALEGK